MLLLIQTVGEIAYGTFYENYIKRFLDIVICVIFLVITSPILVGISIAIKLDSKGPILFKQKRSGLNNRIFTLYKFRSMVASNDVHDKSKSDEFTKVGKFVRKTSLDELPQLINIIKGEMSFIGPRPWITDYSEYFTDDQKRRLEVLPGITGLAQCSGRNDISIVEKINLDIYYVDHMSFFMDIRVLVKTIYAVFTGKGVNLGKESIYKELEVLKQNKSTKTQELDIKKKEVNIEGKLVA